MNQTEGVSAGDHRVVPDFTLSWIKHAPIYTDRLPKQPFHESNMHQSTQTDCPNNPFMNQTCTNLHR